MSKTSILTAVLRRDRWIVIGGLLGVIALSWAYLVQRPGMSMQTMSDMAMPVGPATWTPGYFGLILVMWLVMMAAMMLPSATPVLLLYAAITRRRGEPGAAVPAVGVFALGYVAVWAVFGCLAAMLQWGLDAALLLSSHMATTSAALAGLTLVAAGFYQWSPLKQACLRQCRSPLDFLLTNWRQGRRGALAMGVRHGLSCLGCCWMLMLLLFVGGVMNLLWIVGLSILVLLEKLVPAGRLIPRISGMVMVIAGLFLIFAAH